MAGVLGEAGSEVPLAFDPERGSWLQKMVARSEEPATEEAVASRLAQIEHAVETHVLTAKQAEIDAAQGDTVAKLLTALAGTPDADHPDWIGVAGQGEWRAFSAKFDHRRDDLPQEAPHRRPGPDTDSPSAATGPAHRGRAGELAAG
ncbi:hypothetical protein V5P93_006404 [Actinokineospora auranticolor]|uniref:hypothetical protein n=1 Tax=Actinokineospora auranticolor TaxID=155976 RepID=UPI0011B018BF|nr:hypothetical protein [Actinokineospora auranticolor]